MMKRLVDLLRVNESRFTAIILGAMTIAAVINFNGQLGSGGGVLVPGDKAPHLITKDMLKLMEPGTVLVDVAIDQGAVSRHRIQPHILIRHIWSMESFIMQ